jgi:hypothetical protein
MYAQRTYVPVSSLSCRSRISQYRPRITGFSNLRVRLVCRKVCRSCIMLFVGLRLNYKRTYDQELVWFPELTRQFYFFQCCHICTSVYPASHSKDIWSCFPGDKAAAVCRWHFAPYPVPNWRVPATIPHRLYVFSWQHKNSKKLFQVMEVPCTAEEVTCK